MFSLCCYFSGKGRIPNALLNGAANLKVSVITNGTPESKPSKRKYSN
jgi:hypothetical protein